MSGAEVGGKLAADQKLAQRQQRRAENKKRLELMKTQQSLTQQKVEAMKAARPGAVSPPATAADVFEYLGPSIN